MGGVSPVKAAACDQTCSQRGTNELLEVSKHELQTRVAHFNTENMQVHLFWSQTSKDEELCVACHSFRASQQEQEVNLRLSIRLTPSNPLLRIPVLKPIQCFFYRQALKAKVQSVYIYSNREGDSSRRGAHRRRAKRLHPVTPRQRMVPTTWTEQTHNQLHKPEDDGKQVATSSSSSRPSQPSCGATQTEGWMEAVAALFVHVLHFSLCCTSLGHHPPHWTGGFALASPRLKSLQAIGSFSKIKIISM